MAMRKLETANRPRSPSTNTEPPRVGTRGTSVVRRTSYAFCQVIAPRRVQAGAGKAFVREPMSLTETCPPGWHVSSDAPTDAKVAKPCDGSVTKI